MFRMILGGIFVIGLLLFNIVNSVISEDIKDLSISQLAQLGDDISKIDHGLNADDVTYYLATKSNTEPRKIDPQNSEVDVDKPTKFLIHGWIENYKRSWYANLTNELLANGDYNVIQVDWERPARTSYVSSARDTRFVGYELARFVVESDIKPQSIHLIGHSLGAHVAGFASKKIKEKTGEKVSRISGLDPAGPYFRESHFVKENRLDRSDADVVDVIHTDAGFYGYEFPIGTFDIYVNNGQRIQPGCLNNFYFASLGDIIEDTFCSHARSYKYFTEWVNDGIFKCNMCGSMEMLLMGGCIFSKTTDIAYYDVTPNVTGVCFTSTGSSKPFLPEKQQ